MNDHNLALVAQAQKGEILAFRQLVEGHQQKIYALAFDLTGNHHDAEDLSQEAFIKAFNGLPHFEGTANFGSWLYRITINQHIDRQRKKSDTLLELQEDIDEQSASNIVGIKPNNPQHDTEMNQIQQHIDQALDKLSDRQRVVFTLKHYHHHTLNEIAQTLEIATGTVKSLLFRAIQTLQTELAFHRSDSDEECAQ